METDKRVEAALRKVKEITQRNPHVGQMPFDEWSVLYPEAYNEQLKEMQEVLAAADAVTPQSTNDGAAAPSNSPVSVGDAAHGDTAGVAAPQSGDAELDIDSLKNAIAHHDDPDDKSSGDIQDLVKAAKLYLSYRARSSQGDDGFSHDNLERPNAFIQWKGTDVCMDFHCECGTNCHFDGFFAYAVKCQHCETIWEMPFNVFPRKAEPSLCHWYEKPQMLERDNDAPQSPPTTNTDDSSRDLSKENGVSCESKKAAQVMSARKFVHDISITTRTDGDGTKSYIDRAALISAIEQRDAALRAKWEGERDGSV